MGTLLRSMHPDNRLEVALARKRSTLKRYLTICGITIECDLSLLELQTIVRVMHASRGNVRHAWPLNNAGIDTLSKQNHYVRQLVASKQIWGLQSKIGVVVEDASTVMCHTVADLLAIGCADSRFLAIDSNIQRLDTDRCKPKILAGAVNESD